MEPASALVRVRVRVGIRVRVRVRVRVSGRQVLTLTAYVPRRPSLTWMRSV
jgi:hypothetical protein